jgi:queuine tRNA-ribosyltransferase
LNPTFTVCAREGAARVGSLVTAHGVVETPAFMPVGTYGTVKAMTPEELEGLGAQIILGNTLHLLLRPGPEVIAAHGGLHNFMHWPHPLLTDSGGFQVFSLRSLRRIGEEGVHFRSPVDGREVRLTPEDSMDVQLALRSDIAMALDDCTPYPATEPEARASMERSMRWAVRSHARYYRAERGAPPGGLFGIVQGGMHLPLRLASLEALLRLPWPGFAVGGLAVGEAEEERLAVLETLVPHLPADRPRYLMGVGRPEDIVAAVLRGIDMFDCVMPTRSGRHGQAFTWTGKLNMRNATHIEDPRPLNETSACPAARDYSRAYIHHLIRAGEYLAPMILSWANIAFYQELMAAIRQSIREGNFETLAARVREAYPSATVAEEAGAEPSP